MNIHTALHRMHKEMATVSLKEYLLHSIPKQMQAVTLNGNKN